MNLKRGKATKIIAIILSTVIAALLLMTVGLNLYTSVRIKKIEERIEDYRSNMIKEVEVKTTELLSTGNVGDVIETGVLVKSDSLLSDEDTQNIVNKVSEICKEYLTDDVYKGVAELMAEDLQADIEVAVKKYAINNDTELTEQEINSISTEVQNIVLTEVTNSLTEMKTSLTNMNIKLEAFKTQISAWESKFTDLDARVATLSSSLTNNSDLQAKVTANSKAIADKQSQINTIKSEQDRLKVEQAALDAARQVMQDAIDEKISDEEAIAQINGIIGDLGEYGSVVAKLSAISDELAKADEETKESVLATAQEQIGALKTQMETSLKADKDALVKATQDLQESLDTKTSIADVTNKITSIVGTPGLGTTIMGEINKVNTDLTAKAQTIEETTQQAITELAEQTGEDLSQAQSDLKAYINNLPDDSPLKAQLITIQENAETASDEAKKEAMGKVEELSGSVDSKLASINSLIESTQASLQNGIDGKTSLGDVQSEIALQLSDGGGIAVKLGSVSASLQLALESGDATVLQSARASAAEALTAESNLIKGMISSIQTEQETIKQQQEELSEAKETMQGAIDERITIEAAEQKVSEAVSAAESKDQALKEELENAIDEKGNMNASYDSNSKTLTISITN